MIPLIIINITHVADTTYQSPTRMSPLPHHSPMSTWRFRILPAFECVQKRNIIVHRMYLYPRTTTVGGWKDENDRSTRAVQWDRVGFTRSTVERNVLMYIIIMGNNNAWYFRQFIQNAKQSTRHL